MIIANGVPKSGTHFLCKILNELGLKRIQGHIYQYLGEPRGKFVDQGIGHILSHNDDYFVHAHLLSCPYTKAPRKHVAIVRHPRDTLVSFGRWVCFKRGSEDGQIKDQTIEGLSDFGDRGSFVSFVSQFAKYLDDGHTHIVRFEDAVSGDNKVLVDIAEYLNIQVPKGANLQNAIGTPGVPDIEKVSTGMRQSTWTGELTNWRDYWDKRLETLWVRNGGPVLERRLGYDPG